MTHALSFSVHRDRFAGKYSIYACSPGNEPRLLRDNLKSAAIVNRTLNDLVGGALIAGAIVSYPTRQQVKNLKG